QIGEVGKAQKAYKKLLADYAKHEVTAFALHQLLKINEQEQNQEACVDLRKQLTFDVNRTNDRDIRRLCEEASRELADHYLTKAAFSEGVKALETTYSEEQIVGRVVSQATGIIRNLVANSMTQAQGEKLTEL